jgi:hypothetical protein
MQDGKQGGITPFQAKGGNHTNLLHVAAINEEQKNWPTVRASEYKDVGPVGSKSHDHMLGKHYLCAVVTQDAATNGQAAPASSSSLGSRQGLWLTPRANEPDSDPNFAARNADRGAHCHGTLSSQAKETWWTPQVQDSKHSGTNPTANGERDLLVNQVNWATPRSGKTTDENPETWALRQAKGDVATMPLGAQVKAWATPQAHDAQGPKTPEQIAVMRAKGHGVKNLNEQACWGTPTARDHKSGRGNEDRQYKELTPMVERAQAGKLNQNWVCCLMGVPMGWVDPLCPVSVIKNWPRFVSGWLRPQTAPIPCDSLATELCLPPLSELSES